VSRRLVVIVHYGVGNLASVEGAVRRAGHRALVSRSPEMLTSADLLLLPGVGAFPTAMESLHRHDLVEVLRRQALRGQPLLGICLGMQLLADRSFENGVTEGLGLIAGNVEPDARGRRHIGWNSLEAKAGTPWLEGLDGESFYFNHSYYFRAVPEARVATALLGEPFAAAVQRDRIVGVQFHPEKSQAAGASLLAALIAQLTS